MHSVHIPVFFPTQEGYVIGRCYDGKRLIEAQKDVAEKVAELPKLVWII